MLVATDPDDLSLRKVRLTLPLAAKAVERVG